MKTREQLATYLHFGYLPCVEPGFRERPWSRIRAADVAPAPGATRSELLARGLDAFRAACSPHADSLHVVPLSGGVDSRFILAMLLEAGLRERIVTVTFGIPGTFDFDIAPRVARAAGVRHELIDLTALELTREELLGTVRRAPWSFAFEVHYNHLVFRRFGSTATYWSGNQANSLAGEDVDELHPDWASACRQWAAELPIVRSMRLTPPGFRPESALPERAPLEDSCLNFVEQLFMLVRNPGRNDPAQLPPGFDVCAPFRRVEWVDFILRLPRQVRSGALLYHEIAARSNPALFALPSKNSLGFPRGTPTWRIDLRRARLKTARTLARRLPNLFRHTNPKLNYADDDAELRRKSPLRTVVEDSLQRLESSGRIDWLQPLELLQQHVQRRANIGDALTVLASIELNLFAEAERVGAPIGARP